MINNRIIMPQCKLCGFTCKYESNYKSHLNSKKHKEKVESKNLCDGCFKEFSTKSNKYRHEKKCGIMQNIHTQNNIQTQNNITNNNINIVLPENPEAIKTFFMLIEDLKNKKTTDCFQKLILDEMDSSNFNLMDYIEKFDNKLKESYDNMISDHNNCNAYEILYKIDENGEKYREKIVYNPITHPDYKFECKHKEINFKLNEDKVSEILTETLLNIDDQIVVTHNNDIRGKKDILFKHKDTLHSDEILLEFLSKSNRKELCYLSKNFKPASMIKYKYPEYYDKLEDKAIKIIQAYSIKTKLSK